MRKYNILFIILLATFPLFAQISEPIKISDDIFLVRLTDRTYLHQTAAQTKNWGKVWANGVLLIDEGEAFMFDTPWNDEQTEKLVTWLADSLQVKVTTVVPNHWHEDCMGGLDYLHLKGIKSYASQMTMDIAREKGLPQPQNGFKENLVLRLNDMEVECFYPGAGHATDNIVVWIPSEKVLFPGCMVKDLESTGLGNFVDGDVHTWPATVNKVIGKYPDAKIVVPGHGKPGGFELLIHTHNLLQAK